MSLRVGGLQSQLAPPFPMTFRGIWFFRSGECAKRSLGCRMCSAAAAETQSDSRSVASHSATTKRRVALWIGYVGTPYKGLQIQRTTAAGQTIEQEVEKAIFRAGGILKSNYGALEKVGWMRSSRTDKGVHSLSTVISLKLEVNPELWGCSNDGIGFADRINRYLPETIKIFGIIPVNKSFDARRGCSNRTYRYVLPAETLGITENTSKENVRHVLSCFQSILSSFKGCHPFHNYTVRSQYRQEKNVTWKNPLMYGIREDDNQLVYCSDEDGVCDKDSSLVTSSFTSSFQKQLIEFPPLPKITWLNEMDNADKIFSAHFRRIFSFTCGELQNYDGFLFLEIEVHGESFMLHQIRKMIGTAIAVIRSVLPSDVIPISLSCASRVVLPIAPSEALFLASNEFYPFRTCPPPKGSSRIGKLPKLEMSAKVLERKQKFWNDILLPHIVNLLQVNREHWDGWLERLERRRICESEMQPIRKAWTEWSIQRQKRRAAKINFEDHGQELDTATESSSLNSKNCDTQSRTVA